VGALAAGVQQETDEAVRTSITKQMRTKAFSGTATLLCLGAFPLLAVGAQVSVDNTMLAPGGSGIISVSFAAQGDQVSAMQFDIEYDSTALNVMVLAGPAMRSAEKNIYYAAPNSNLSRILLAALNQDQLGDGAVLTLVINANPNALPGVFTVALSNASAVDPSGNPVLLPDGSGVVTIAGSPVTTGSIQTGGVVNAGSLLPGPVSPGEIVALIGSEIGPTPPVGLQLSSPNTVSTVLSDTRVMFDSFAAPLLYAGPTQINAIVPYEVSGTTTMVTILRSGQTIGPIALPVTAAVPAIFTQNASGTGQGSVLNLPDFSLNTPARPAPAGSAVAVYLTGIGQDDPTQITGRVNGASDIGKTLLSVTATVAGLPAKVLYAGPATALVAGATQVNLVIPTGVAPSIAAPIVIHVGNTVTQGDVVVSVGFAAPGH
jgi:uncharacterized protein (TIGR03437 family)